MSVNIPRVAATFYYPTTVIDENDIIECRVHLGCTKEVSSFELLLQNWNGKYGPNGSKPLTVGMQGSIAVGRVSNPPLLITCRIESLKYVNSAVEHYLIVSGRCIGERLFRRVFTGTWTGWKAETIVMGLIENYVGLSHTRDGQELIESTDTTYTKLEYENTPVFEIIRYIADTADKNGVIGYDFRVAPDGKFEFFRRNSKTSSVSLSETVEEYEYRRDISRIRNKIYVYGAAEKKTPTDANDDGWTEATGNWLSNGTIYLDSNHVTEDGQKKYTDSYSVYAYGGSTDSQIYLTRLISSTKFNGPDGYKQINTWINWTRYGSGSPSSAYCRLFTSSGNYYEMDIKSLLPPQATWGKLVLRTDQPTWTATGSPSWNNITAIGFYIYHPEGCIPVIRLDHLYLSDCRFYAMQEDSNSQSAYGLRELTVTDEELKSDNECLLRAKALLDYYKNPTEHLTIKTTVLDYGSTPIQAGDKISVTLPNEGINGDFRVESIEYRVDAKTQTLEVTLELGRETPLLADYLYALKSKTDHLSRYKVGVMGV